MDRPAARTATVALGLVFWAVVSPVQGSAADLPPELLADLDSCLRDSATTRDVANTSVACFNAARSACVDDPLACEAALTVVLAARADVLRARMPQDPGDMPEFARERYRELLAGIDARAQSLCDDIGADQAVSCSYRAQAVRLARLRSLGAQVDPRLVVQ